MMPVGIMVLGIIVVVVSTVLRAIQSEVIESCCRQLRTLHTQLRGGRTDKTSRGQRQSRGSRDGNGSEDTRNLDENDRFHHRISGQTKDS